MADHGGWFKIYERVLNDPKLHEITPEDRWAWVECLCIASIYGDETGRLRSLNGMAFLMRRSENDTEAVLERLVNAGLIDTKAGGKTGSYWCVHDWEKWQGTNALGSRAPPRDKTRQDKTRLDNIDSTAEAEKPAKNTSDIVDLAFERFKRAYPKRDGDQGWKVAKDKFALAVRKGTDPETIIAAAEKYRLAMHREGNTGDRAKFVKQAATWMNQRMWEEYSEPSQPKPATNGHATDDPQRFQPKPGQSWEGRLLTARQRPNTAAWPRTAWGPAPGEPGCLVPPEILTTEDTSRQWPEWSEMVAKERETREMLRENP